jgi:hypothetical protein
MAGRAERGHRARSAAKSTVRSGLALFRFARPLLSASHDRPRPCALQGQIPRASAVSIFRELFPARSFAHHISSSLFCRSRAPFWAAVSLWRRRSVDAIWPIRRSVRTCCLRHWSSSSEAVCSANGLGIRQTLGKLSEWFGDQGWEYLDLVWCPINNFTKALELTED